MDIRYSLKFTMGPLWQIGLILRLQKQNLLVFFNKGLYANTQAKLCSQMLKYLSNFKFIRTNSEQKAH